ncbi:hypothetical protein R3P38DRAFT_2880146 [Favolaschia claudopus]|uniref:Uncharacterized protein n=1 Tax=Favolaschia claudopus TaxID=2862362 RepID=A0AAW0D0W9_9AGAR
MSSDQGKGKARETIEIEDDDARLERIQRVLGKLNTVSPAPGRDLESIMNAASSSSDLGAPNEESLNDLLARVQAFLPQIESSNAALSTQDPRTLDIENTEGDDKVIQMKLGLGVFEDRSGREGSRSGCESCEEDEDDDMENSDESSSGTGSSDETSSSSEAESSSSESDDSDLPNGGRKIAPLPKRALVARSIKPLPGRARPEIVVLSETTTNSEGS